MELYTTLYEKKGEKKELYATLNTTGKNEGRSVSEHDVQEIEVVSGSLKTINACTSLRGILSRDNQNWDKNEQNHCWEIIFNCYDKEIETAKAGFAV